jgi:two-component system cell cycle sensor histidine kinase PleC
VTRKALVSDAATLIEGVNEPIAFRYPPAISSGFAIIEHDRYVGMATMSALLQKTVDLAHRRAVELEEVHRKAEIARRAESRLLAIMSHELRTPLNATFAELVLMRDLEPLTGKRAAATSTSGTGARIADLINDVLDHASFEADHLPLSETVFDLRLPVHDGRARRRRVERHHIRAARRCGADRGAAGSRHADPGRRLGGGPIATPSLPGRVIGFDTLST